MIQKAGAGNHPESIQECSGEAGSSNEVPEAIFAVTAHRESAPEVPRIFQEVLQVVYSSQSQDLQLQLITIAAPGNHPGSAQDCSEDAGSSKRQPEVRFAVTAHKESSSRRSPRKCPGVWEFKKVSEQDLQLQKVKKAAPGDHPERGAPMGCWELKTVSRNKICKLSL